MKPNRNVIIITGASGGLGAAVTSAFLDSSACVAAVARSMSGNPSDTFLPLSAELSNLEQARAVVSAVLGKWVRVDALVHLVGGFTGGTPVADSDDAALEKMLDLNLRTAYSMMRAVLPVMRAQGSGRIIAIGSRTAVEPAAGLGIYSASKAALVSLVRTVALENKDKGITANVVLPGTMDTPANRSAMRDADPNLWIQPSQIAALLVHLASGNASQITGAVIPVYGIGA
ncbi:MAG: SDR family NAD(P)-dependent oxidoreductase [Bryobacteraceae bacterium]